MKIIFGLILLALFAVPSHAQSNMSDGTFLLGSCQISIKMTETAFKPNEAESFRDGLCLGLVRGVMYASPTICPGKNVSVEQMVRVVLKYLQDHPEKLNLDDAALVQIALSQAFPCGKP